MKSPLHFFLALSLLAPAARGQSDPPIGYVAHVTGTVHLQAVGGKDKRLAPGFSVAQRLYDGDRITCDPASSVTIRIGDRKYDFSDLDSTVTLHSGNLTDSQRRANEALAKLGLPGASRSISSLIYSPAADASMRLATFRVRWNPPKDSEPLRLTLTDSNGAILWSQAAIDSSAGLLPPQPEASLKAALTAAQKAGSAHTAAAQGHAAEFTLALTTEMHGSQHIHFTLLTLAQEAALDAELKAWTAAPDRLLGLIGAAQALESANLPVDAADAYDDALKLAPQSEVLLETSLGLHQSLGDRARTLQLRAALDVARAASTPVSGGVPAP